jgi:hypothetical protein
MTYGPKTKLAAFNWWQNRAPVHPMTCGNESAHDFQVNLVADITMAGTAYLICPVCNVVALWEHDFIVDHWRNYLSYGVANFDTPGGTIRMGE